MERGFFQREIQDAAYRQQQQVDSGERVIVGVNCLQEERETVAIETLRIDPDLERAQVARLRALRLRRPEAPWRASLQALEARARTGENLVPAMVDAVLAWATVGEIANTLRTVFGEHRETLVL